VTIGSIGAAIAALANPIGLIVVATGTLGAAWAENWGGIREKTATAMEYIGPVLDEARNTVEVVIPQALFIMRVAWEQDWGNVRSFLETTWSTIKGIFNKLYEWVTEDIPSGLNSLKLTFQRSWAAIRKAIDSVFGLFDKFNKALRGFIDLIKEGIPNPFEGWELPPLPQFARGTSFAPGGLAMVGEQGAELVRYPSGGLALAAGPTIANIPRGSQVFDAQTTSGMFGGMNFGEGSIVIYANGNTDTGAVRIAARDGVLDAARSRGVRL